MCTLKYSLLFTWMNVRTTCKVHMFTLCKSKPIFIKSSSLIIFIIIHNQRDANTQETRNEIFSNVIHYHDRLHYIK